MKRVVSSWRLIFGKPGLASLLIGMGAAAIAVPVLFVKAAGPSGTLAIPPLLTPIVSANVKVFNLSMQHGQSQLLAGGPASATMGFNGAYLGPTIRVSRGDAVRMSVTNNLGEDTTVHWHGLHVPAMADGGIMGVIPAGQNWTPQFMINQRASTNWYHPHIMGSTSQQIANGLVGMFLIDDGSSDQALLPNQYGINDIPLIFQSDIVGSDGAIKFQDVASASGDQYPLILNGANVSTLPTLNTNQGRLRLRVLNASIGDILTFSLADGGALTEIATDGGLLPAPLTVTSVRVGPAERVEILVDVTASRTLQAAAQATLLAGASGTRPVLQINGSGVTSAPAPLPAAFAPIAALDTSGSVPRAVNLTTDGTDFGINGVIGTTMGTMMSTAMHVTLGTTGVWNVSNSAPQTHFFHMHDGSFQILSVNGASPAGDQVGWKDTVEVTPGSTVKLAMQYLDYSDTNEAYMLHCHLAPHEDQGMMALFYVDPPRPAVSRNAPRLSADFDGDGKADFAVWRPWTGNWHVMPTGNPAAAMTQFWGTENDVPVAADYDGDGKTDYAVWRPSNGTWFTIPSSAPLNRAAIAWGTAGDIPVPGDYNGDGKADLAIFRPSNGYWWIAPNQNTAAGYAVYWGTAGDVPVAADYDGDGKMDVAVWRPSNGTWYIIPSSGAPSYQKPWGVAGDIPVVGDYDGDGKADLAVFRPSNGVWFVIPSSNPSAPYNKAWGTAGDMPAAHDVDGDGRADFVVFRPFDGAWYVQPAAPGSAAYRKAWGVAGDIPL